MAQWWHYRGRVTATIDLPGKPGYVVRPRQQFEAPMTAVANLVRKKLVVPCRVPKSVTQAAKAAERAAKKGESATKLAPKSDLGKKATPASGETHVVASEATKAEATPEAPEVPEATEVEAGEGDSDSSTEPLKEESGDDEPEGEASKSKHRRRRGR